mgnify:CR=1 FL=1
MEKRRSRRTQCAPPAARKAFRSVIAAIAESETVYVAVNPHSRPSAERMLAGMANVRLLDLDSDDAWARDVAPTFVRRAADGAVRGVNWLFNAWGGEVDGLYAHWERTMPSRAACWICSAFAAMMPHRS